MEQHRVMSWPHASEVVESWTVRHVMSAPVHIVAPAAGVRELVRTLREHGISALPVVDGEGRLLGVVSEADMLVTGGRLTAAELMTAPAVTVGPDLELSRAAGLMREKAVRRLIVVDDSGHVIGVASRSDLLKMYLRDDDVIKRDVQAIVRDVLCLQDHGLLVKVRDGKVGIHGKVPRRSDANLITLLTRRLPGVVAVKSAIAHDEDDTKLPSHPWDTWFSAAARSQGGKQEATYQ